MKFSQRAGINPEKKLIQINSVDEDLKNGLWNALILCYWNSYEAPGRGLSGRNEYVKNSNLHDLILIIWIQHFKNANRFNRCILGRLFIES